MAACDMCIFAETQEYDGDDGDKRRRHQFSDIHFNSIFWMSNTTRAANAKLHRYAFHCMQAFEITAGLLRSTRC